MHDWWTELSEVFYVAVDFDGTIVYDEFPEIGPPMRGALEVLRKWQIDPKISTILWTCRDGQYLENAVSWLHSKGLEMPVNENPDIEHGNRKLVADVFIDDRNVGGLEGWKQIAQHIWEGQRNHEIRRRRLREKLHESSPKVPNGQVGRGRA